MRQRFGQRLFHRPLQARELVQVVGQLVVFDQSPVFRLVLRHNAKHCVVGTFLAVSRFSVSPVAVAFLLEDVQRYLQLNFSVDMPFSFRTVRVFVHG